MLSTRNEQQYVAIAAAITMEEFSVVPGLSHDVYGWLGGQGLTPSGPSFVRILTSDMAAKLDIEVGVTVDGAVTGDERMVVGSIPQGTYGTLVYGAADQDEHIQANAQLQTWAGEHRLEWAMVHTSSGDVWGGRFQFYLEDQSTEDNQIFELIYLVTEESAERATI
jgi:effector-binding domain-containing protein